MSIFKRIYDYEINFSVSTFWDGGYDVKLGDDLNGYVAEGNVEEWEQVEPLLETMFYEHYPEAKEGKK